MIHLRWLLDHQTRPVCGACVPLDRRRPKHRFPKSASGAGECCAFCLLCASSSNEIICNVRQSTGGSRPSGKTNGGAVSSALPIKKTREQRTQMRPIEPCAGAQRSRGRCCSTRLEKILNDNQLIIIVFHLIFSYRPALGLFFFFFTIMFTFVIYLALSSACPFNPT